VDEFLLTITLSSVTKWLITAENKVLESSNLVAMFTKTFTEWQSYILRQKVKGQVLKTSTRNAMINTK